MSSISNFASDFTLTINGRSESGSSSFDVIDPSCGRAFASCPDASRKQLDSAVDAARAASAQWRSLSWETRGEYLRDFSVAIRSNIDELSTLLTREQGKVLAESKAEIRRAADNLNDYASQHLEARVLRDNERERIEEQFCATGVAGVISPWNVPIGLFVMRAAPFLQSGSTVIAKPSPYTPLTTLKIGELACRIFPPGVLNVLAAKDPFGQWMTEHPGIDRVSFTGSIRTGKHVIASAAGTLKRVGLELGGNDAAIVLDDVDVDKVASQLFWASMRNCGQICMAVKRVYVHESVYERMLAALATHARAVKVGNGLEPGIELGPLQNQMQLNIVRELLEDTRKIGGIRFAAGGGVLERPGYFVEPTVVADIPDHARLVREEQFGPVLPVLKYTDIDDAVARANDTLYGLGASVWSSDTQRAADVAVRMEAGTVWVNSHMILDADTPFGGWKESGVGRGNGQVGLQACMESRVVRVLK